MEFILEGPNEIREACAKPCDADRLNSFMPSVLIIRGHRKNLFEKHLRSEVRAICREFGATIAAQNSATVNRRGQVGTRDARKELRLLIFNQRHSSEPR